MKRSFWLIAVLCLMNSISVNAQLLRTTVEQGEIEGVLHEGFALYKAIPYAEAPVGELRWKMPVAKKPWTGVYNADKWGNRPYQVTDPNQGNGDIPLSEDCLYLSVETPAQSTDEKLPVFVMIHGGGFSTGSYIGTQESFVKEGIVYVSVEYRLGALGFMAHPNLTKESKSKISGNYGIYDQIMALNWIHNNIAAFGGDPEKVTICGESAGGISVSILCASPLCKGLFRGAISESGGSFCPVSEKTYNAVANMKTLKAAETIGKDFQKKLGVKNVKDLRKLSAQTILDSTTDHQFWPIVDGNAIVDDQYRLYEKGAYNDVNVMAGYNSDEGSLFVYNMSLDEYKEMASKTYGSWKKRLYEAYSASDDKTALYAVQDIMRDKSFGWGTYAWANLQTKTGQGKFYFYYFDQQSQNSILKWSRGATHVAEMPFIYGWNWGPMSEIDTRMAEIMPQYWINFIKTGDPNGSGIPFWTPYKQGEETVMNMHNGFHLTKVPNQKQMDFWEEYFKSFRENK
ncbi:MAG: carboxylesterase family protein [Bacteroidales bacterium]|nr:carboxylesterase family protein [Bacteroidales bacterium]